MIILPLTYLGSTEWFAHLLADDCVIDTGENWVKQTARNRCEILTSTGVAALTVPVHGYGAKIPVKDIRIDNSKRWQHQHWQSLVSAYRNSPFFDHYEERFAPFYEKKLNYLTEFNIGLLNILTGILGVEGVVKISENYITAAPGDIDLRGKKALRRDNFQLSTFNFNLASQAFPPRGSAKSASSLCPHSAASVQLKYTQVFSDRMDFEAGLSVIDLLFCEGGQGTLTLLRSCRR